NRYLPGPDHLVTTDQAGDGTVTDGDQKVLAGYCGQIQNTRHGLCQINAAGIDVHTLHGKRLRLAMHTGRLTKQHAHGQIDGHVIEMGVLQLNDVFLRRLPYHRERAALARTQRPEQRQVLGADGQHVALLRLVAPDLQRRHLRLSIENVTQRETPAAATVLDQLGQRIGQATGTDVVNEQDRVLLSELPALVDDLLAASFHLGVVALHRGEVEIAVARARGHGRRGTATKPDQHGGTTQNNQLGANGNLSLVHVLPTDVAQASDYHDGLVVPAHLGPVATVNPLLIGAEVATEVRAAELVVEGGRANGPFDHDVQ